MTHAGDVTPTQAWEALGGDPAAVLVDVRTRPELAYVGYPDLGGIGKRLIAIEWQQFPTGAQNPRFVDELASHGVGQDATVYFICRSGARSRFAASAAAAAGWESSFNVEYGFEGPIDGDGHRGTTAGWKADGLPWRQS